MIAQQHPQRKTAKTLQMIISFPVSWCLMGDSADGDKLFSFSGLPLTGPIAFQRYVAFFKQQFP